MPDFDDVTGDLGEAYSRWKESEKAKNQARQRYFDKITEALEEEYPTRSSETIEAATEEEALRIAQRRFQRHKLIDITEIEEGKWEAVLQEDPKFKEFTYVNRSDGNVYSRSIREGSPILDDEGLQEENPQLWEAITTEVTGRKLKPLDTLTPEQVQALDKYITMPQPTVSLPAPRKAKPEELE